MEALNLTAPSFIHDVVLPRLAAVSLRPVRAFGLPRAWMGRLAAERAYDAAVTVGRDASFPDSWLAIHVGELRHALFAAPTVAARLGPLPSVDAIRATPFVAATFLGPDGALVEGDDRCPLPRSERIIGHEVETMRLAVQVAAETEHLAYGPTSAAAWLLAEGRLVEVNVPGWAQSDPLYLAWNPDAVSADVQGVLAATIRAAFREMPHSSGIVPIFDAFDEGRAATKIA